jgi:hypothetical protein
MYEVTKFYASAFSALEAIDCKKKSKSKAIPVTGRGGP